MAADQARREFPPNEPSEASNRRARDERSGQNKGEESLVRQARIGWQKGSFTGEDMQCRYQGGPAECTEGERIASVASSRGSISCSCVECRGQSRRRREKQNRNGFSSWVCSVVQCRNQPLLSSLAFASQVLNEMVTRPYPLRRDARRVARSFFFFFSSLGL